MSDIVDRLGRKADMCVTHHYSCTCIAHRAAVDIEKIMRILHDSRIADHQLKECVDLAKSIMYTIGVAVSKDWPNMERQK